MADDTFDNTVEELDEEVATAVRHVAEEAAEDAKSAATAVVEDDSEPKKKRERRSKQARAAKQEQAAPAVQPAAPQPAKVGPLASLGMPAFLGICAACLAVGLLIGRFALGGSAAAAGSLGDFTGKTTIAEEQLDDTFVTYTANGETASLTVRQLLEQTRSVEAAKTEDGSYTLPSAETALTVVRNEILLKEAAKRGFEASEDDITSYAEKQLGTSDFDVLAEQYQLSPDMVKQLIGQSVVLEALQKDVIGGDVPEMPEAPAQPEEGSEDKATRAYAKYILELAGDEWDSEAGAWAAEDGRYATAFADADFNGKKATYAMAQTAYSVAYQEYIEQSNELYASWSTFYGDLMSGASVQVASLTTQS